MAWETFQIMKLLLELVKILIRGDQLGMFHFGGSPHVLLFRPEVKLEFNLHGQKAGLDSENIKVHDEILRLV